MSKWREKFKVHPAADVFPMMSDEELAKLGEDIKANGLKSRITFFDPPDGEYMLLDGRNRIEAMERVGIELIADNVEKVYRADPVAFVISANIHRRHLTKAQQADLIVAALKASRKNCEVPKRHVKGKAGSQKDEVKAEAVDLAAKHGIGKRTVEAAMAKAELTPEEIAERKRKAEEAKRLADERMAQYRKQVVAQQAETNALREMMLNIVDTGYRTLARKFHPDKGGSTDDMARLNEARRRLCHNFGFSLPRKGRLH
jgi:ParB-like chromosome segregation protein Spo0J